MHAGKSCGYDGACMFPDVFTNGIDTTNLFMERTSKLLLSALCLYFGMSLVMTRGKYGCHYRRYNVLLTLSIVYILLGTCDDTSHLHCTIIDRITYMHAQYLMENVKLILHSCGLHNNNNWNLHHRHVI